ncbi:S1 family peptidase [Synechococcus sp. WH 8020]|uniref:S1 family peptidase n=1 Tax=Synechococcus sp. (strain WH8020) TaxID=32052 RepID=UPI001FE1FF03|nr:serine protease [Synechococcus sp. WH 8020]
MLPLGQPLLLGTLGITTATTAVLLQAPLAVAQDASAVARIAKAITVRIEGATQGSGVIVKREGNRYTVLTAWHVVSGNRPGEEVGIYTPDGKEHQLEQGGIQRLGQVDMALIVFNSSQKYSIACIRKVSRIGRGDLAHVAGYPIAKNNTISILRGRLLWIDDDILRYTNKTQIGISGGPVMTRFGDVIGIHVTGELDPVMSSVYKSEVKTGVNAAVRISNSLNASLQPSCSY